MLRVDAARGRRAASSAGQEARTALRDARRRADRRRARRRRPRPRRPRPRPARRHLPHGRQPTARPWCSPTRSRAAACRPRATRTTTPRCSPSAQMRRAGGRRPAWTASDPWQPLRRRTAAGRLCAERGGGAAARARHADRAPLAVPALARAPAPQADLDPGRARPAAGRPSTRRPRRPRRAWSPAAPTSPRRPTSAAGSTRPACGRSRSAATGSPTTPNACCAGREVEQRPAHRARHRRGQPRRPARRARRDLVAVGRAADPDRHASTTRSSPGPWSRGPTASTPAASRSWSARPSGRDPGTGGRRAPVDHHAVDRARAARLHRLGAGLRPGPRVVLPARDVPGRRRRAARRRTSGSRTRPIDPALADAARRPGAARAAPPAGRRRRLPAHAARPPTTSEVTLVGVGAIMPEVLAAAERPRRPGRHRRCRLPDQPRPGVPLVPAARTAATPGGAAASSTSCSPPTHPAPLVTVLDGHPHTLVVPRRAPAATGSAASASPSSASPASLADAYALHGIDTDTIVDAALTLIGR